MFEKISILLGSSVVACIITSLFNWAKNKNNNSLNYITGERKEWREKIRKIAKKIEECKYKGEGKNNIERYLLQLQMNLNPYGRDMQLNYKEDGHIWKTIEDIRNADNNDEFEKHKKLLLGYLSILLKEDWERSKREIKGYSNFIIYLVIELFVAIICSVFYFYILRLEDMNVWFFMIILNISPLIFSKWMFFDELDIMEDNYKKEVNPNNKLKNKYKEKKVLVGCLMFAMGYIILNMVMLILLFPRIILSEMEFKENNDTLYIHTKLDINIWENLDKNLEEHIKKNVIIIDEKDNNLKQESNYDEIILDVLVQYMYNWVIAIWYFTIINFVCVLIILAKRNYISRREIREIDKLKKKLLSNNDMYIQLRRVIFELELEIHTNRNINKEYINIMYRLLEDIEEVLKNDINKQKYNVKSIESYNRIKSIEELWQDVKEISKRIEKYSRVKKNDKQKKMIIEIVKDIKEKVLCNLK